MCQTHIYWKYKLFAGFAVQYIYILYKIQKKKKKMCQTEFATV